MDTLQDVSLVAATVIMGLMAGVFGLYSNTIMPGLRTTDDRTFVGSFQAVDRAIINPLFMACFLGALALTALAGASGSVTTRARCWVGSSACSSSTCWWWARRSPSTSP